MTEAQMIEAMARLTAERDEARMEVVAAEMAFGCLHSIQELLDSGGVPRGTFADDQVRNLVAMFNKMKAERDAALADCGHWRKDYNELQRLYLATDELLRARTMECDAALAEIEIWKSVFPDIAPDQVLPDRAEAEAEAAPMNDDLLMRIADACIGHPHAKIPWPHRLLHECRDRIEALEAELKKWRNMAQQSIQDSKQER